MDRRASVTIASDRLVIFTDRMELLRHPASSVSPVSAIRASAVRRPAGRLSLLFEVDGELPRVRLPTAGDPARRDGLWRHSCFEAFVQPACGRPYFEINLAPSGDWAAYQFDHYRTGMAPAAVDRPVIACEVDRHRLRIRAEIELADAAASTWQLGLAAIIEDDQGGLSYWALRHDRETPDFHDPDCFVVQLPPADRP